MQQNLGRYVTFCVCMLIAVCLRGSTVSAEENTIDRLDTLQESSISATQLSVKTNLVGWALLSGNVAVELQLAPRWSLNLPIFYSAFNYFDSTIKFRAQGAMLEVRYFECDCNCNPGRSTGFYVGPHIGIAYYNMAIGGSTRFQDHGGVTPAWGGGLGFGYVMRLGHSRNWMLEYGIGMGIYRLHYDKFDNYIGGKKIGEGRKNAFIVDNVSLTLSYTFEIRRRRL